MTAEPFIAEACRPPVSDRLAREAWEVAREVRALRARLREQADRPPRARPRTR